MANDRPLFLIEQLAEARDMIKRLTERCEAYKGQVKAGSDEIAAMKARLATMTEPTPAWLAIPGLLVVSALVLAYAATKARKLEVSYSE